MSRCRTTCRAGTVARRIRLVALVVGVSFAVVGCGSSEPKTQVLGEQEQQIDANDVELLDPICITNTPAHDPC